MVIMIFDTETIGKVNQDLLNVGYKIIDLDIQHSTFKTLQERNYVITNLINNRVYCINDDFVGAKKYALYQEALANKTAIKRNLPSILKTLSNDIKKYKVLFAYAYNSNFDVDKFKRNSYEFAIPVFDIWSYAYEYIIKTDDYKQWCIENEQLTESEIYISSTVETVERYLLKDLSFKESHTALDDVQHETNILVECVKRGCDITRPMPKAKRVASDKIFHKIIKYNGQEIELEYSKTYERNGVITYK